jgi:hypothetical protein
MKDSEIKKSMCRASELTVGKIACAAGKGSMRAVAAVLIVVGACTIFRRWLDLPVQKACPEFSNSTMEPWLKHLANWPAVGSSLHWRAEG